MHPDQTRICRLARMAGLAILSALLVACGGGETTQTDLVPTLVAMALTATASSQSADTPATEPPPTADVAADPVTATSTPATDAATSTPAPVEPTPPPTATVVPTPTRPRMQIAETAAYQSLPEIALVSPALVIATPLQPTSYLDIPPIPAGERVRVVARDNDGTFILVLYDDNLNWISAISAGFVSNLQLPVVSESPQSNCTGFLGVSRAAGETWSGQAGGQVFVRSLIYRPQLTEATPSLTVSETGRTLQPSSRHPLAGNGGEVLEFASAPGDLPANSPVTLQTAGLEGEPSAFQAVFTTDDCAMAAESLSSVPTQTTGTVTVDDLPVWSEPDSPTNTVIGQLDRGDKLALTGTATGGDGRLWWRILLPSGKAGWIEESAVEEEGCVDCVPVIPRTIVLRITSQTLAISRLVLIDAVRDVPVADLSDGTVIRLSDLPTRRLDIEAISPGTQTESIVFYLDGQLFCANGRCVENVPPYAMAGDVNSGDHYNNWDWSNMIGRHTITAVGCDEDNGMGTCGAPFTVSFTVTR